MPLSALDLIRPVWRGGNSITREIYSEFNMSWETFWSVGKYLHQPKNCFMNKQEIRKTTSKLFLKMKKDEHEILIFQETINHVEIQNTEVEQKRRNWLSYLEPKIIFEILMQIVKAMF